MEQALQYFKQTEKVLDANEFEDEESYQLFMQNVFAEVEGLEYRLACSHDGSVILEKILRCASSFQLCVFFEKVRGRWMDMACHRYASHVVETWCKQAALRIQDMRNGRNKENPEVAREGNEGLPQLGEQLEDMAAMVTEQALQLMEDPYGTHILRLLIRLWLGELDGAPVSYTNRPCLEAFIENLFSLPQEVFNWTVALQHQYTSPVLQLLMQKESTLASRLMQTIFLSEDQSKKMVKLADDEVGSRFFEAILLSLAAPDFLLFFTKMIRPNFERLLEGRHANFIVQTTISQCHNLAQFELVLDSLKPIAPTLIGKHRHGVLLRLVQWVVDHEGAGAEPTMNIIYDAFHLRDAADRKAAFVAISRLQVKPTTKDDNAPQTFPNEEAPLSIPGLNMLQHLPWFPASTNKPVIDGFLDYSVGSLVTLSLHPTGSRVVQATLSSRNVSEKAKLRTCRKLRDHVTSLATDKFGSHIVEALYSVATTELREQIVAGLLPLKARLLDTPQGRLVWRNCRVEDYEHDQESWKNAQDTAERRKNMFADLLQDDSINLLPASLQSTKSDSKKRRGKTSSMEPLDNMSSSLLNVDNDRMLRKKKGKSH